MVNGGQVCLCPDYVFVPREHADEFVTALSAAITQFFPASYADSEATVTIVNERGFDRISALVQDAVDKGARKITPVAAEPSREERIIPPTLLVDVPDDAEIAREEIFGPVLTIHTYDDLAEVIAFVNDRSAPLAAYWYGEDSDDFQRFLEQTTSGGVTRNDGILHAALPTVPFGGVGGSGTGAYVGKAGFDEFSHRRAVVSQVAPNGITEGLVGPALLAPELADMTDQVIAGAAAEIRSRLGL